MSIAYFDQTNINDLLGMLKFQHTHLVNILRRSPHYSHYLTSTFSKNQSEEKTTIDFINKLLRYMLISNKVAYSLQYREPICFDDSQIDYAKTTRMACSLHQLYRELNNLRYNTATNDGNRFVDKKWYEPFEAVRVGIADLIAAK